MYSDKDGGGAHPGPTRISDDTGIHSTDVKRHLRALVEDGWIIQTEKGGSSAGRRLASEYRLGPGPTRRDQTTGSGDTTGRDVPITRRDETSTPVGMTPTPPEYSPEQEHQVAWDEERGSEGSGSYVETVDMHNTSAGRTEEPQLSPRLLSQRVRAMFQGEPLGDVGPPRGNTGEPPSGVGMPGPKSGEWVQESASGRASRYEDIWDESHPLEGPPSDLQSCNNHDNSWGGNTWPERSS